MIHTPAHMDHRQMPSPLPAATLPRMDTCCDPSLFFASSFRYNIRTHIVQVLVLYVGPRTPALARGRPRRWTTPRPLFTLGSYCPWAYGLRLPGSDNTSSARQLKNKDHRDRLFVNFEKTCCFAEAEKCIDLRGYTKSKTTGALRAGSTRRHV